MISFFATDIESLLLTIFVNFYFKLFAVSLRLQIPVSAETMRSWIAYLVLFSYLKGF